jgi:hypothetical protein
MIVPRPVIPDYQGPNLVGLIPALSAPPGNRPDWVPEPLKDAEQVVLLVIDGLGWLQLQERAELAPVLSGMLGGTITSVAPTTTATALTSITVSAPPAAHGIVGYKLVVDGTEGREVMNVLRWRSASGDMREVVDPSTFQPILPFGGRPVPVVSKAEFNGTGFSTAHQRGAPLAGWVQPSSLPVEVRRLIGAGTPLVYAYYEGIDKVAHFHGFGDHYDAELVAVDRIVGDLLDGLPAGVGLAVTSDHGQVEVGERATGLDPRITSEIEMASGEARFRWLHAASGGSGSIEKLATLAGEIYGDEAWVATCDQMEADGWFGGPLSPTVRARLGDVAVVPYAPVGYLAPTETSEPVLVCRHGSLTPEEMFVPFLGQRGRLGR